MCVYLLFMCLANRDKDMNREKLKKYFNLLKYPKQKTTSG